MFDNNDYINSLFGNLSSSTTTTEKEEQSTYSPQSDYLTQNQTQTYQNPYEKDDYSSTQNFTEEQTYNSTSSNVFEETQEKKRTSVMVAPTIKRSEQAVSLVKSQSRVRLETRMKTVLAVFSVIVACLMFISIFNFISAKKIEATFADKQLQINMLEQSISELNNEYIRVTSDENLKQWAEDESNNFVEKDDYNTKVIYLDEAYIESTVEEIPSNWFNDVCEFFSKLFA